MSVDSNLVLAVRDRLNRGQDKDTIKVEVLAAGHSESVWEEVLDAAQVPSATPEATASGVGEAVISYRALAAATWQMVKTEWLVFVKTLTATALVGVMAFVVFEVFRVFGYIDDSWFWYLTVTLLPTAAYMFFSIVMVRALIRRAQAESYRSHALFVLRNSWQLSVLVFAMTVLILAGYVVFIIPGIVLTVYLFNALFFALDERASGINALVESTVYTHGRFWSLLIRQLVIALSAMLFTFVTILLSFLTVFLAPVFMILSIFGLYYVLYSGYIVLYESVIKAGVVKALPIEKSTLKGWYTGITALAALGVLGVYLLIVVMFGALDLSSL